MRGTVHQLSQNSRRFVRQALKTARRFSIARRLSRGVTQAVTTSASTTNLTLASDIHNITSDNTGLTRAVAVGATGTLGQRKLITLVARPNASDKFTLDAANLRVLDTNQSRAVTSLTFDTVGHYALLEYQAGKWTILATNAKLV